MIFKLKISPEAKDQLSKLKHDPSLNKRYKAVNKALDYLRTNPRHSSLNIHIFETHAGPGGAKIWEAYAENNTPGAYRIFFSFGPDKETISIISIIPHPD
jgi:mRNA-degrading endonuclease RelE of RelBE toxin-antitoxin system